MVRSGRGTADNRGRVELTVDEHARPDLGALRVQHNGDVRPGDEAHRLADALQRGSVRLRRGAELSGRECGE